MVSFDIANDARGHELGSALFALGSLTNVLIDGNAVTVTVRAEADWATLEEGVKAALLAHRVA